MMSEELVKGLKGMMLKALVEEKLKAREADLLALVREKVAPVIAAEAAAEAEAEAWGSLRGRRVS